MFSTTLYGHYEPLFQTSAETFNAILTFKRYYYLNSCFFKSPDELPLEQRHENTNFIDKDCMK